MNELKIAIDKNENKIVIIPSIIFTNKQNIIWNDIENYLKKYVGSVAKIVETNDIVYIGKDFPDEYAGSSYTHNLKGARAKAKANAVQGIIKMIEVASSKRFNINKKQKHFYDACNGWYYYTTRFALPIYDNRDKTENYNIYKGCFVINHASNNKLYLYDLVDIKKEASNPLKTMR